MKTKLPTNRLVSLLLIFNVLLVFSSGILMPVSATDGENDEASYYVCFSYQNYSVRGSNKMTLTQDGYYILSDITLSSADDFYVTDNRGIRYLGCDNEPISVKETGRYSYDIRFSPDEIYDDEGKYTGGTEDFYATDAHVTFRFHASEVFSVFLNGDEHILTFNPYNTSFDMYYISSLTVSEQSTLSYSSGEDTIEEHILNAGSYRVLFTPDKVENGNLYKFDKDGNYGSGDKFIYNLYIEDAPLYYAVFEKDGLINSPADTTVKGKNAYRLTRYEKNIAAAEYRTAEFFLPDRDTVLKYSVYEYANNSFVLIDDDNDKETKISKLTATDAGWYTLSFLDMGSSFSCSLNTEERDFRDYYLSGTFNGYCFDADGEKNLCDKYRFIQVEEEDDDYNEDYEQYIIFFTVSEKDLREGDIEFFITDGKLKYKSGDDYIKIKSPGRYKILFSTEHFYSSARNYRYTLVDDEEIQRIEIIINTEEELASLAEKCSVSADYSKNLAVYLASDLDFSGKTFKSFKYFSGKFFGGYHTLSNITLEDKDGMVSIFETLSRDGSIERLYIKNLTLSGKDCVGFVGYNYGVVKNVTVDGSIRGERHVGGIAAFNGSGKNDEDSSVTDSSKPETPAIISGCNVDISVMGISHVGGIAGENEGKIYGSSAGGNVRGEKSSSSDSISNIGGICGYSSGEIYDCENNSEVNGGDDSSNVGGICGRNVGQVYFCTNKGPVFATRHAGGICGYLGSLLNESSGSQYEEILGPIIGIENESKGEDSVGSNAAIYYSVNYADILSVSNCAGIAGSSYNAVGIYHSSSMGNISATAGNYAGGITSFAEGIQLVGCMSSGNISAKGMQGGNYVGGIAGYADYITGCMSTATVKGEAFLGGIAGYASDTLLSCYANTHIISSDNSSDTGNIAGTAAAYDRSTDSFGTKVKGNYYIGIGGIGTIEYASGYNYAAASITPDLLSSLGSLSPFLSEDFVSKYWQGGTTENSYPTLYYFETISDTPVFCDDELWSSLFELHRDKFMQMNLQNTKITYTVVFMEWNKDNGDLYDDDGNILYENFDVIRTVRINAGETVNAPVPMYANEKNGLYIYEGNKARYYVDFGNDFTVNSNITVYASYQELLTSISSSDKSVFAEGEFIEGTSLKLITVGDYFKIEFYLNGKEIFPSDVTIKIFVGDNDARIYICNGKEEQITNSRNSGDYIEFKYDGGYFKIASKKSEDSSLFTGILIGSAGILAIGIVFVAVISAIQKGKKKKQ